MIKIIRFNESINPFKYIKNYGLSYIFHNNIQFFENVRIKYLYYHEYERINTGVTFSQYKKYINNIFLNKLVLISFYNKNKDYLAKIRISSVSINKLNYYMTFRDKYNLKYTINDDVILDIEEYMKVLKTLIDQNISFYRFINKEKNYKNEFIHNFTLKNVYIKNDNIYMVNDKNVTYILDIFGDIKKGIIINDIDPYGEEDWDELNENIIEKEIYYKFNYFLNFKLLGLKKLNKLRNFLLNNYIVISKNDKFIKGRVIKITPFKIEDEQYYKVNLMTNKGEIEINIIGDEKFKVKKNIKSKIDPFDEEEWELFDR